MSECIMQQFNLEFLVLGLGLLGQMAVIFAVGLLTFRSETCKKWILNALEWAIRELGEKTEEELLMEKYLKINKRYNDRERIEQGITLMENQAPSGSIPSLHFYLDKIDNEMKRASKRVYPEDKG